MEATLSPTLGVLLLLATAPRETEIFHFAIQKKRGVNFISGDF